MLCPSGLPMVPMVPTRTQRADRQGTTLHNRMTQRWRFPNDSTMHCRSSIADPPCSRVSCAHCVQNPWSRILWGPLGPVCCTLGFCLFNQLNIAQRWKQLQHHETSHVSLVFGCLRENICSKFRKLGKGGRQAGRRWRMSVTQHPILERSWKNPLVCPRAGKTRIHENCAPAYCSIILPRDISEYVFGFLDLDISGSSGIILNILNASSGLSKQSHQGMNRFFWILLALLAVAQLTGHHLSASASIVAVRVWFQDISVVAMITS